MDPIIIELPGWMSYLVLAMCFIETISICTHVYEMYMCAVARRICNEYQKV